MDYSSSITTTSRIKVRFGKFYTPQALRTYLAECISTFIFALAAIGSAMSSRKIMGGTLSPDPSSLVAVALANAFALSSAVYIAGNVSGGHVNPAVTFGLVVGGHVPIPTAIFYWISQMLGATMACLLLKITTVGQKVPTYAIVDEMTGFGGSILEGIATFALVYTVYSTMDPRRGGTISMIAPLMIGLVAGASVLSIGAFTGGSMNPSCSFGAALIAGSFKNQAVYWVGPLLGAALAGLLYEYVMFPSSSNQDYSSSARASSEHVGP